MGVYQSATYPTITVQSVRVSLSPYLRQHSEVVAEVKKRYDIPTNCEPERDGDSLLFRWYQIVTD